MKVGRQRPCASEGGAFEHRGVCCRVAACHTCRETAIFAGIPRYRTASQVIATPCGAPVAGPGPSVMVRGSSTNQVTSRDTKIIEEGGPEAHPRPFPPALIVRMKSGLKLRDRGHQFGQSARLGMTPSASNSHPENTASPAGRTHSYRPDPANSGFPGSRPLHGIPRTWGRS